MEIYIQENETLQKVNQQNIFNDLYNLGKILNNCNDIKTKKINLVDWDKDKTYKYNKKVYDIQKRLDDLFKKYLYNMDNYKNKDIKKSLDRIILKYGYPFHTKDRNILFYSKSNLEILVSSLYAFLIVDLLESIKNDKYYEYQNKFVYFSIKKRETILFYVKNIANFKFGLYPKIKYENDFIYIFDNWCKIAGLVIFAMIRNIDKVTNKDKTILCKQCGCLFVYTKGRKFCSIECEKEDTKLRQRKCRANKKTNKINN